MNSINLTHTEKIMRWHTRRVYWQGALAMIMIFLAFSRWLATSAGGGTLTPEEGLRGRVELGLTSLAFLMLIIFWGVKPFFAGFKLPTFVALFIFGLWAATSAFWSPNFIHSAGKAYGLLIIILCASAIAYQAANLDMPVDHMAFWALMVLIIFLFFINLIDFGTFLNVDWLSSRPRFVLAYEHPNMGAGILTTELLIGAYLFMRFRSQISKLGILSLVVFLTYFLYLTDSRTAILAGLFSMALILSASFKPKGRVGVFIFSAAILINIIFFLMLLGVLQPMFQDFMIQNPEWQTLNGRTRLWESIFNNPSLSSFFGIGYYGSRYLIIDSFSWGINSHNSYLEVLFTTGVIGFVVMVAFYIASFSLLNKRWSAYPLPLVLLVYASIESLAEVRLFTPGVVMFVTCLFIFHYQFLQRKNRVNKFQPDLAGTIG